MVADTTLLRAPERRIRLHAVENPRNSKQCFGNNSLQFFCPVSLICLQIYTAKEDTQQLQSSFRRRRSDDPIIANDAKAYLASRKKANKLINKSLRDLKINKCGFADVDEATCSMLRDVEGVTFTVLKSVFSYITATMPEPKSTNWSLVSKLVHSRCVTCKGRGSETNELERVNALLCGLIGYKSKKCGDMSNENAVIELQRLETSIEDVEDGIECVLKLLIKTRVSILNILSH
ncbi:uncharacterized protein LOC105779550 isoform X2 [Gossypium raimondii]|uniref:uncharacterized protein LOC105779550 isoform X2 n=1 Tax=Gossypium raimondii TaxID=29730 RepID=UPI00227CC48C|nr:uncharacterized protein LOC105779550 isoform X2 [Gossypium raimondii]